MWHGCSPRPAGDCGTDIEHDPLWQGFTDWVLPWGIRACWSVPIVSRNRLAREADENTANVLGSFALYHRQVTSPSDKDLEIVTKAAHLAAIAIERDLSSRALRESEAKFSS